jgi:hypothetical protein
MRGVDRNEWSVPADLVVTLSQCKGRIFVDYSSCITLCIRSMICAVCLLLMILGVIVK